MPEVADWLRALGMSEYAGTPALRREQIALQVALMTTLMQVKGYAAPETKAAAERAHLLIEQAKALGEPPEDELLEFSVLGGFWAANFNAFNGDAMCELAGQYLVLADRHGGATLRMNGHRLMGQSLVCTGLLAKAERTSIRQSPFTIPHSFARLLDGMQPTLWCSA